jgi:hypothetical protein
VATPLIGNVTSADAPVLNAERATWINAALCVESEPAPSESNAPAIARSPMRGPSSTVAIASGERAWNAASN